MVGMRVTREEKRALQVLAEYQTEGNLAELLRSRVFPWANRALADRLTGYTER
jgi:hypothetical protein